MGKQIEYYSEMDSYMLIVNKAIELGLKIITKDNNIIASIEEDNIYNEIKYFYLEEAGSLKLRENGIIDILESPIIEANPPYIKNRKVYKSRLWVSSGFWMNEDSFVKRDKKLEKKYDAIVRYLKKITNYVEIEVKDKNPDYERRYFLRKIYITETLYDKVKNKEYEIL